MKSDPVHAKVKGGSSVNGSDIQQSMPSATSHTGTSRSGENQRPVDESTNRTLDESTVKVSSRVSTESEEIDHCLLAPSQSNQDLMLRKMIVNLAKALTELLALPPVTEFSLLTS